MCLSEFVLIGLHKRHTHYFSAKYLKNQQTSVLRTKFFTYNSCLRNFFCSYVGPEFFFILRKLF